MKINGKLKRYPIRDLHSPKEVKPRFCDLTFDGRHYFLETKLEKEKNKIALEDFLYQLKRAKELLQ